MGYILMRTLVRGIDVPGYASLLVAILFFGSLQLIGMRLLGEYVGRISMETKQRPVYLVRSFHQAAMENAANSSTTVADRSVDQIRAP
jgi:polyisoprenyl-phosphate glycosyltransferase